MDYDYMLLCRLYPPYDYLNCNMFWVGPFPTVKESDKASLELKRAFWAHENESISIEECARREYRSYPVFLMARKDFNPNDGLRVFEPITPMEEIVEYAHETADFIDLQRRYLLRRVVGVESVKDGMWVRIHYPDGDISEEVRVASEPYPEMDYGRPTGRLYVHVWEVRRPLQPAINFLFLDTVGVTADQPKRHKGTWLERVDVSLPG